MADEMLRIAGRGEDGLAKAIKTDEDGNVRVQVIGRETEITTLVDNNELRTSAFIYNSEINMEGVTEFDFRFTNTLKNASGDVPLEVAIWGENGLLSFSMLDGRMVAYEVGIGNFFHLVPNVRRTLLSQIDAKSNNIIGFDTTPFISFFGDKRVRLRVFARTAPTQGAITIELIKRW